jgi:hypothetical protein
VLGLTLLPQVSLAEHGTTRPSSTFTTCLCVGGLGSFCSCGGHPWGLSYFASGVEFAGVLEWIHLNIFSLFRLNEVCVWMEVHWVCYVLVDALQQRFTSVLDRRQVTCEEQAAH